MQDVQLHNANAWANFSQSQEENVVDGANQTEKMDTTAEDDTLWSEFQGRELQKRKAEEQKRKIEEEERRRKAEAEVEAAKAAEEHARAAKEKERELLEQEARELRKLTDKGAEEAEAEILRQAGHESQANLEELGLAARDDDEDMDDEEVI